MRKPRDAQERFWERVNKNGPVSLSKPELGPCWLWVGVSNSGGYVSLAVNSRMVLAHRYSYILEYGGDLESLELDHLCRNKICVNPKHLEPVTHAENMRRARGPHPNKTACKYGHEYTVENTGYRFNERNNTTQRYCKRCSKERVHEYYKRLFKGTSGLLVQYE